jgi:hypothetical protein
MTHEVNYSFNLEPMLNGKLAQMGLYLPKVGFNTNPGGFLIVHQEDETVCVALVLDVTMPEAAIFNCFPLLRILDFDAPTGIDLSIRHQTKIFHSEAIAVVSSTSIIALAFVFHSEEAVSAICTLLQLSKS